jgi:hypothetical protein
MKRWIEIILILQVKVYSKKGKGCCNKQYKADMKSVLGTDVKYAPLLKRLKVNLISDVKIKKD